MTKSHSYPCTIAVDTKGNTTLIAYHSQPEDITPLPEAMGYLDSLGELDTDPGVYDATIIVSWTQSPQDSDWDMDYEITDLTKIEI